MKKTLAAAVTAAACAFAAPAMAQSVGVAGGFSKGKTHLIGTVGTGYAFDESYLVLGLGVSYYLFDGFNVGLSLRIVDRIRSEADQDHAFGAVRVLSGPAA